jgi:hypothetical protein
MPKEKSKKISTYAPPYDHGKKVGAGQTWNFRTEWDDFKDGMDRAMQGPFPQVDCDGGPKATVFSTLDIRFDREKSCKSNGQPQDKFINYSAQANKESMNSTLSKLAKGANGQHRVPAKDEEDECTFGGSTIACVNLQDCQGKRRITPKLVRHAVDHSAKTGQVLYVTNKEYNETTIPQSLRQRSRIYHDTNPYKDWPDRKNPVNPYHKSTEDGRAPTTVRDPKTGKLVDRYPPKAGEKKKK